MADRAVSARPDRGAAERGAHRPRAAGHGGAQDQLSGYPYAFSIRS
jgi:hypothetical protein